MRPLSSYFRGRRDVKHARHRLPRHERGRLEADLLLAGNLVRSLRPAQRLSS